MSATGTPVHDGMDFAPGSEQLPPVTVEVSPAALHGELAG